MKNLKNYDSLMKYVSEHTVTDERQQLGELRQRKFLAEINDEADERKAVILAAKAFGILIGYIVLASLILIVANKLL